MIAFGIADLAAEKRLRLAWTLAPALAGLAGFAFFTVRQID